MPVFEHHAHYMEPHIGTGISTGFQEVHVQVSTSKGSVFGQYPEGQVRVLVAHLDNDAISRKQCCRQRVENVVEGVVEGHNGPDLHRQ